MGHSLRWEYGKRCDGWKESVETKEPWTHLLCQNEVSWCELSQQISQSLQIQRTGYQRRQSFFQGQSKLQLKYEFEANGRQWGGAGQVAEGLLLRSSEACCSTQWEVLRLNKQDTSSTINIISNLAVKTSWSFWKKVQRLLFLRWPELMCSQSSSSSWGERGFTVPSERLKSRIGRETRSWPPLLKNCVTVVSTSWVAQVAFAALGVGLALHSPCLCYLS